MTVIKNHCLTILTYLPTYQILDMNELTDSKELPPNEDMKYQLRFITIHEGQGGGFQGNEDGTEDKEAPQAHYFGYLCNFATSQWYQLDDDDVEEVEEKIVLEDAKIRPTCCITYAVDQRNIMCATRKINLYVHTPKNLPWQYQQLPLPNHLPLHLPPDHQKHQKETIQKGSLARERIC